MTGGVPALNNYRHQWTIVDNKNPVDVTRKEMCLLGSLMNYQIFTCPLLCFSFKLRLPGLYSLSSSCVDTGVSSVQQLFENKPMSPWQLR